MAILYKNNNCSKKKITMKHLLYIIVCTSLLSCASSHIGKYVYYEVWRSGCRLHVDRDCPNFGKNGVVQYIETASLKDCPSFCPKCVSDEDAAYLNDIMCHNSDSIGYSDTYGESSSDY